MAIKRFVAILLGVAVVATLVILVGSRDNGEVVLQMDWMVDDPCPDAVVIGAAGSGQSDDISGIGPQVASAFSGFGAELTEQSSSSVSVGFMALDYPAVGLLDGGLLGFLSNSLAASIDQGRDALNSLVATINERCPNGLIYLIGYSQGAAVVHATIDNMPAASQDSIGGVAVIADPNRDAGDPNTEHFTSELDPELVGTATPHDRDGVFGAVATPTWLGDSFYSACARRDAVCNFALLDVLVADVVHTDETYNGLGPQLGRLLAGRLLASR